MKHRLVIECDSSAEAIELNDTLQKVAGDDHDWISPRQVDLIKGAVLEEAFTPDPALPKFSLSLTDQALVNIAMEEGDASFEEAAPAAEFIKFEDHPKMRPIHSEAVFGIGFWASSHEPGLPAPVGVPTKAVNQDEFCHKFEQLQKYCDKLMNYEQFRGFSYCRICNMANGSRTYYYSNWAWPQGLLHYIREHNVRMPLEFIQFVEETVQALKALKAPI